MPAGVEAAVHTVRAWFGRNATSSGKLLLKLDFSNAFNTISREQVVAETCLHFSGLARWVGWCYRRPSALQFGSASTVQSAGGVQQGDPLGPLLFSAALQSLAQDLRGQGLDLAFFYLDDGVIAGDVRAVVRALQLVQRRAPALGLRLNLSKCEVVGAGLLSESAVSQLLPLELLQGASRFQRSLDLLGAAIGDDAFVSAHTNARVEAAAPLLDALAQLEDAQVGLRLLRSCAGYTRLVHSMRCAPPTCQRGALQRFDSLVCSSLAGLTGFHLDAAQLRQAARAFAHAGLGLRSAARDAFAAYLASVGGCADACRELDPAYSSAPLATDPYVLQALSGHNALLSEALTPEAALSAKQKTLTALADEASWREQLAACSVVARAVLLSEAEPGARAFLAASPVGRTRMDSAIFVAELRQRLGMPDAASDLWCPQCQGVLDRFSLHAATCVAGGERNQRHNALRDLLCSWAERAGLQPEKERPGLLLPQRPEDSRLAQRRPADVYLPSLKGFPAALDLAVVAPQRQESLAQAGQRALAAATAYSRTKEMHLDAANACAAQGVRFHPLVVEATGAWSRDAAAILTLISQAVAAREGDQASLVHARLLQELSVVARSHRARAVLRRRSELAASG